VENSVKIVSATKARKMGERKDGGGEVDESGTLKSLEGYDK